MQKCMTVQVTENMASICRDAFLLSTAALPWKQSVDFV